MRSEARITVDEIGNFEPGLDLGFERGLGGADIGKLGDDLIELERAG